MRCSVAVIIINFAWVYIVVETNRSCIHLLKIFYHKSFWNPYTSSSQFRTFAITLLLAVENKKKNTGEWSSLFLTVTFILFFAKMDNLKQKLKGGTCARFYRHVHS